MSNTYLENFAAAREQYKKDTDASGEGLTRNTLEKSYAVAPPLDLEDPNADYDSFDDTYQDGYNEGYADGYREGETYGREASYDDAYNQGYEDARSEYERD